MNGSCNCCEISPGHPCFPGGGKWERSSEILNFLPTFSAFVPKMKRSRQLGMGLSSVPPDRKIHQNSAKPPWSKVVTRCSVSPSSPSSHFVWLFARFFVRQMGMLRGRSPSRMSKVVHVFQVRIVRAQTNRCPSRRNVPAIRRFRVTPAVFARSRPN